MTRLSLLCVLFLSFTQVAGAQNPNWPNRTATRAEMMDPANWPDDPNYGYDVSGDGTTCIDGGRCWTNDTGGQWNFWSWVPPEVLDREEYRAEETDLGAGTWTDMAWTLTTGSRDTMIAVLDSGINWDERDLTNQFFINRAELEVAGLDVRCLPQAPDGHEGDPVDLNGDGSLSMRDWFHFLTPEEATTLRGEIDAMGNNNGVAEPGDLITFCSDGVDDDGNGYIDDISGWDFHHDDNDPADDTRFGHGTSEARWSAAEGNNGMGRIGYCPNCSVLMVRAGDSFVADSQDFAQSVVYATDAGASIIQEALGTINHTTFMRRAIDYAYNNDVLVIASAADENSYHHNMPGTADHNLYIHAVRFAGANPQNADSFLAFNNCTNFGGQLAMSAPGTGCSSEATAVGAGIGALILSASNASDRPGGPIDPRLSAEELRQLITMTADDINIPESIPGHPDHEPDWYPSVEGWDQRFGWGRINAYQSTLAAWEGRIPPNVDLYGPDWFKVLYPSRTASVTIEGTIEARRADSFDYVIEWAAGIEPEDDEFTTLAMGVGETESLGPSLATWDISGLEIDNGQADGPHNRHTVTVRIRATAHYGGAIGDVRGEQRRVYAIAPDDTLLPNYPLALGVRHDSDLHPGASGESSPKLANLDGDPQLEIVYGDADGLLHVINAETATEMPGFPIRLGTLRGLDPADPNSNDGAAAYASGDVPFEDVASSILSTPAIGDIDADGTLEIVVITMEGDLWVVNPDGTIRDGFPVGLPEVLSADTRRGGPGNRDSIVERGAFASPSLADLDGDGNLEIVQPAFDGNVYVYREDGSMQSGFPVTITAPLLWLDPADAQPSRIMTSAAIGDANGDGLLDIAVGSNEYGDQSGTGAVHLIHGDGNDHAGGAAHDNWPVQVVSLELFPLVGRGVPSAVAMADINDDGRPDLAIAGTANRVEILDGIQPPRAPGEPALLLATLDSIRYGALNNVDNPRDRPLLNTFASGSFGDLDQDGHPDYFTGGAGLQLGLSLAGGHTNAPFNHMVGAWSTIPEGDRQFAPMLPGFPQVIEDYLFFMNPTSADVSGDGYPEVITGSGGYYVHAWDACGRESPGFPKFVGSWIIATPAVGDMDGDGLLEIAIATRMGYLYVFDTDGPADGSVTWPEWRHDNANTGNFDMPLDFGEKLGASEPLVCDIPDPPVDAGPGEDAGPAEDAGPTTTDDDGCGCRTTGASDASFVLLLGLAFAIRRRR